MPQEDRERDIMELHESKGETYNLSAEGFVFSESQIRRAIQARNRARLAEEAHRAAAYWHRIRLDLLWFGRWAERRSWVLEDG